MAEVSVVWAVLAEQGAAANPYPLRSWGCAVPLPAVDHQLPQFARSGWLSLTFGFSLRRRNILVARSPFPHLHEISGRTARDQQRFLRLFGASVCHNRCINLSRSEKYIFANLRYLRKPPAHFNSIVIALDTMKLVQGWQRFRLFGRCWPNKALQPTPIRFAPRGCADLLPAVAHQ